MSMDTKTDTQSPALHVARANNLKDVSIEIPKRRALLSPARTLRVIAGLAVLTLGLAATPGRSAAADEPAEQFQALVKEWSAAAGDLWHATTDDQRHAIANRVAALSPRMLELAEKHPGEAFAMNALVQVLTQELWLVNNTLYPGRSVKPSLEARAISQLLRDHLASKELGEATRRARYGFSPECEKFLRVIAEKSPHRELRAVASIRLAQCLNDRRRRLDLLRERPEMARRYEGLFGKEFIRSSLRRNPDRAGEEVEALFNRAAADYGDVELPYEGKIAERVREELHEMRHLTVGRPAQEIAGEDQDGQPFKLSDYRGKVVLLYFWSEY